MKRRTILGLFLSAAAAPLASPLPALNPADHRYFAKLLLNSTYGKFAVPIRVPALVAYHLGNVNL